MPVCITDPRAGVQIPLRVEDAKGAGFFVTGEFVEVIPFRKIVHIERMYLPDPTPENHVETRFDADGVGTLMTMRRTLPDSQTRHSMSTTGMERGMEASYQRLEKMQINPQ